MLASPIEKLDEFLPSPITNGDPLAIATTRLHTLRKQRSGKGVPFHLQAMRLAHENGIHNFSISKSRPVAWPFLACTITGVKQQPLFQAYL
jgi:hypothetical protein